MLSVYTSPNFQRLLLPFRPAQALPDLKPGWVEQFIEPVLPALRRVPVHSVVNPAGIQGIVAAAYQACLPQDP